MNAKPHGQCSCPASEQPVRAGNVNRPEQTCVISTHFKHIRNAADMAPLEDNSVDLVVTSPPYPMIKMWDDCFIRQDKAVFEALGRRDGWAAFDRMHRLLDRVWDEVCRVVKPGRFVCINIGDAVRKIGDEFSLFTNHARIISAMVKRGLTPLPAILWRKQTNAPNKFMGSGMLPAGAYVTLEHEYILVFRKGGKRDFETAAQRQARRESAIFWEERNQWYSDIWYDLKGTRQALSGSRVRNRSGAFPFELPYRLISMYSVTGDTVLDPFSGIGTTALAAMAAGRSSVCFEIEPDFAGIIPDEAGGREGVIGFSNRLIQSRIDRHVSFTAERIQSGKPMKYINRHYGVPVVTRQETDLFFSPIAAVRPVAENGIEVTYADRPLEENGAGVPAYEEKDAVPGKGGPAGLRSYAEGGWRNLKLFE